MVKRHGQADSQISGGVQNSPGAETGAVIGGSRRKFGNPIKRLPRKVLVVVILLVLVGGAALLYVHQQNKNAAAYIPTKNQALQQEVEDLLASPPAVTAPASVKADYYEHLQIAQEDVGNYKGAVDAFQARKGVAAADMSYLNYYYGAKDYCKVGDKVSARAALAQSKDLILAQANESNGDDPARSQALLDKLASECGL